MICTYSSVHPQIAIGQRHMIPVFFSLSQLLLEASSTTVTFQSPIFGSCVYLYPQTPTQSTAAVPVTFFLAIWLYFRYLVSFLCPSKGESKFSQGLTRLCCQQVSSVQKTKYSVSEKISRAFSCLIFIYIHNACYW